MRTRNTEVELLFDQLHSDAQHIFSAEMSIAHCGNDTYHSLLAMPLQVAHVEIIC